jgi:signal transduction histidine kinase
LTNAVAELERANAGKNAFMAAVSHELRTPLTGILGLAETLEAQKRGTLNEYQFHYVEGIMRSGHRLLEMVNSILAYTGAMATDVAPEPVPCSLMELCASSVNIVSQKAEAKHQLITFTPADLEIYSDPESIVGILTALLDNAVKFTPDQGSLGVAATKVNNPDAVRLIVWDTGIGISEDQVPYLFKPFTQIDQSLARQYEGVGLGLAFVKRKVELLGGSIALDSTAGKGSRFEVIFPLSARTASLPAVA